MFIKIEKKSNTLQFLKSDTYYKYHEFLSDKMFLLINCLTYNLLHLCFLDMYLSFLHVSHDNDFKKLFLGRLQY